MTPPIVKTTCPYCGVGCGINATVIDAERHLVTIQGDPEHPANFGRLCSKGGALADTVSLENRLLYPEIDGRRCDWDAALTHVAERFKTIIAEHGPESVAFYVSGQLLTEDYYVANKLMKGCIGTANIDTNSRLCMSSAAVGYKRAFGADTVPCNYQDIDLADLIVLAGSNAAWCHPVAFQRMRKAKDQNPELKIVVIDPRATATCDIADLHLAIKPGTDALLFNGLLAYLAESGCVDKVFVEANCLDYEAALANAKESTGSLDELAHACGLSEADLSRFFSWFANFRKVVTVYSQGINQSSSGSDKCNAIINCHLASGKIGKPGMGPFSFTGQPNAMGGREVGGMANTLAAHMDLENPQHVDRLARFWQSGRVADKQGLKAVEMFDAVADGRIKALWIMATNPVVSMPDADKVKRALEQCEFLVVSDCIAQTDTVELAHVKLPATGWSEKDGTVTNLERRISRQRALFAASGEAKPDWWIVSQVAGRMGFSGFGYRDSAEIFAEHAALSGFENDDMHGKRDFDISGLANSSREQYDALQPIQWPVNAEYPSGAARLFEDGRFFTDNRKARFIAVTPSGPVNSVSDDYPFVLNTGRLRDQWHTMTRTALAPRLNSHRPEPTLDINPLDAGALGLIANDMALLESRWGTMLARVNTTASQRAGSVFVPMHWTAQLSSRGRVGPLVNPAVDPISGQPESKHTPVNIKPWQTRWQALVLSRHSLNIETEYAVKIKGDGFWRYLLAGQDVIRDFPEWGRALLAGRSPVSDDYLEYRDSAGGDYRLAYFRSEQLESCLFVNVRGELPEFGWISGLFVKSSITRDERISLLSGVPPKGQQDTGRTVCSCFGVGDNTIVQAIKSRNLSSVAEIGECLGAGTGCGSCISELKNILAQAKI